MVGLASEHRQIGKIVVSVVVIVVMDNMFRTERKNLPDLLPCDPLPLTPRKISPILAEGVVALLGAEVSARFSELARRTNDGSLAYRADNPI